MSERLPSRRRALSLLLKAGCSSKVVQHCRAVATIAAQIAGACEKNGLSVDAQLVEIGALLHDIGRSKTHSVDHVVVGAEIAKSFNLPTSVTLIIERHAGGGITADEARRLGWPAKSYLPQTLEEKIVTYADKLIEGSRRVPIDQTIKKFLGRVPRSSIERMRRLHEEFSSLTR